VRPHFHAVPGTAHGWVSDSRNDLCARELEDADAWSSEPIDYTENAGGPGRTRTYNQQFLSQQLNINGFNDFPKLSVGRIGQF
jgi:hypothetical protein